MIRWAVIRVAALAVLHLFGARAEVGILSGTRPGGALELAAGVSYALAWFGAVLVAPVLAIAALLRRLLALPVCGRIVARTRSWIASGPP